MTKRKALVTGAGGLVGSAAVRRLCRDGWEVVGIENDMRAEFFGTEASTMPEIKKLWREFPGLDVQFNDIRDKRAMSDVFRRQGAFDLILHTAAQPSHDWAAREPHEDFTVNANGTLTLLQCARTHSPQTPFCHISTSKVYGDRPNDLPLGRVGDRLDLKRRHPYHQGITTDMSIDQCLHSLFGVSKIAGDLLAQEYGRYFDMPTVIFRPGCITGPAHQGVELHGFLAYLMKCCATGRGYVVYGYGGLQVRCNIYADDLVDACLRYAEAPSRVGAVYNIGGGRPSACSMLEAIEMCEQITGRKLKHHFESVPRVGDHRWWISDISEFRSDYPEWQPTLDVRSLLQEIHDKNVDEWKQVSS